MKTISISDIKGQYGHGEGKHWFDKDTMRFFRTRLPQYGYEGDGGIFFVSSEQNHSVCGNTYPRRYTVRQLTVEHYTTQDEYKQHSTNSEIKTVGPFNEMSRSEATRKAQLYSRIGAPQHIPSRYP